MAVPDRQEDEPIQNTSRNYAHNAINTQVFDVIIVGAGVVGCALARRFILEGVSVAVVEKATDILDGASKANSAILHTGFDTIPDSIELSCIRDGYREYMEIHKEMNLPLENTGAHVVAWGDEEEARLAPIVEQAHANGIDDVKLISKRELLHKEPNLSTHAKAAIAVAGESIIDPWSAPYAYLRQALINGGQVYLNCEVADGEFDGGEWRLETSQGWLKGRQVINCAGLYGDQLDNALLGGSQFNITPRKGQFVVFDKAAAGLVSSIILPVPTSRTKGVVVCRTIFGNVIVGPTAEDQESRSDASTDETSLKALIASGAEKFPELATMPITAFYAGLRPASEYKDYQIKVDDERNWITVGGIRSTGLSGALGIARHVFALYSGAGHKHQPIKSPEIPQAPVLAQSCSQGLQRDWQQADYGEIVCHCELVTKREIERALDGPLAARSLAGLKRQTRVTMGRCQGFYCMARLAELTEGHFKQHLAELINDG